MNLMPWTTVSNMLNAGMLPIWAYFGITLNMDKTEVIIIGPNAANPHVTTHLSSMSLKWGQYVSLLTTT